MKRIITAGVVGAIVLFVWGMAAFMVLPLHTPTMHQLPEDRQIAEALSAQNLESGVYTSPFPANPADMSNPESPFMKNHEAGPIFSIYYRKEGAVPMNPGVLGTGFVIDLLATTLAAWLLSMLGSCGNSYGCRVGFVAGMGVLIAIVGHLSYWNWMYFPLDYTLAFVADVVIGWTLAGLAIAYFVRPADQANSGAGVVRKSSSRVAAAVNASRSQTDGGEQHAKPQSRAQPTAPIRNDAINLLATLQREARFIDIVKEPLADYTDAQVGAAARDVLRDCGAVLDRMFKLEPVVDQEEGSSVEIPSGVDASTYRIAGDAGGHATSGSLVHHGWQAKRCELPKWTGAKEAALIVSPAELEVK